MKTTEYCKRIFWASAALSAIYLMTGCATSHTAIDNTVASPVSVDTGSRPLQSKLVRRSAAVLQGGTLYARSFYVDPVNRPVSNALSAASFAFKSVRGLTHRAAINAVQFPELERRSIPELSDLPGMDLERWENDLDQITGQKRNKGTIKFLVGGEEYFSRLERAIHSASESIDIRTYIFDNDDYAVTVADQLKRRADEIDVRIHVDALGNLLAQQADAESASPDFDGPLSMGLYLEADSNVEVRSRANPWLTGDHTKTTIIDSEVAFVGGMNIGREYRYDWHDLMMEVRGPIVDQLKHDSDKAWAHAGIFGDVANFLAILRGKKSRAADIGYDIRPLYTRNFDSQIYRAQLAAIRRAQDYIIIENAYFSDDAILYELSRARRRGVDVRVILPTAGNHGPLNASNQVTINRMLDNGIRVYLYPGMSHIKAAVFDGWACIGSANFDKLSLEINKELNLATSEPSVVAALLERVLYPDMARSVEVSQHVMVAASDRLLELAVDEFL